jgi:hypothetical protein
MHEETTCIFAYFLGDWLPCDAFNTKLHPIKGLKYTITRRRATVYACIKELPAD